MGRKNKQKELEPLVDFRPTGGHCWFGHKEWREIPPPAFSNRTRQFKCVKCGKTKRKIDFSTGWG